MICDSTFPFPEMYVPRFAADESFVRFAFTREQPETAIVQRITETVSHEPSSFLRYSEITSEFTRTDAVFAVNNKPESRKPLIQPKG